MTKFKSKAVISRGLLLALSAGLFLLLAIRPALAQTTFGSLSNFDVFNDTGQDCHGFEIELDGITSANVVYTFGGTYQQYGTPVVTNFAGGVYVRYESPYDPAKGWQATTPVAATPITPTMGHACWTGGIAPAGLAAYPKGGCEHFGLSLSANPTNTVYRWLVADPTNSGSLIASGSKVSIPAPVWSVAQPVPAQPLIVAAVIPAPPLPPVPVCEFGDAQWVKVYVTQSPNPADLNHLVSDDPNVPQDPVEVETEWSLQQTDSGQVGGGARAELPESAALGAGNESVTRRYEFYKYTGAIDPETCEALSANDSNPPAGEVGDYIGAQMAAVNVVIPATSISVPVGLAFGGSPVGNQVSKILTIKNTGKKPLIIQSVASNNSDFVPGVSTCPAGGLAPALTCTIAIAFTPSALGARTAALTLTDNAGAGTQNVALSGTGLITTTVAPAYFSIGNVKFGAKVLKTVTVNNKQPQTVSLTAGISGPNAADFSITGGTCGATLNAKTSCTIIVTFTPGAIGSESATLTVTPSPDPIGPYTVGFTVAATIPATVTPAILSYGNIAQSATKTLNVKVTNLSPLTLTLSQGISGTNAADFGVAAGGTCAGNTVCLMPVTFTPSTEAAETATLTVSIGSDPASPHSIALSGTGVTPVNVLPLAGIAFGAIVGGHSSLNKTVTVYNYGGATLTISESIGGVNPGDFAVTGGTCGATLAGGAHCTYLLKFTPGIIGAESATLGVSAVGDAASPHNVSLTGIGS